MMYTLTELYCRVWNQQSLQLLISHYTASTAVKLFVDCSIYHMNNILICRSEPL